MSLILSGSDGVSDIDGTVSTPAIRGTDANTGIFFPAADTIAFSEGGVESMRIDSSGNLLVGTTSSGGIGVTISGTIGTNFWVSNTNTTSAYTQLVFQNPNGTVGSIQTSGSSTSFNTSSDYRLKENIAPMTGALDKVAQLKPCTYTWKFDGSDGQGFIAHELQKMFPDAVTGEKDAINRDGSIKPQGVDTSFLVATLTAAIKELKAIVDAQAIEIAELKAK